MCVFKIYDLQIELVCEYLPTKSFYYILFISKYFIYFSGKVCRERFIYKSPNQKK